MTEEEIYVLTEDELDREVAERVMGWHKIHQNVSSIAIQVDGAESSYWADTDGRRTARSSWRPSRDMNDAIMVMRFLQASEVRPLYLNFLWDSREVTEEFNKAHRNSVNLFGLIAHGETEGIAICRAALLAQTLGLL